MLKLIFLICGLTTFTGIYDYTIKDINGKEIQLSEFRGKMLLLVNTASASKYTDQYASLEKLHQLYKNELVIIAFPTNSFGKENGDDQSIKNSVKDKYKINFILARKTDIKGARQEPLYNWLTQEALNKKMIEESVNNNFYKFLIDTSGNLVGAFSPSVDPMSEQMLSAIQSR